jgi:hypothetical protein
MPDTSPTHSDDTFDADSFRQSHQVELVPLSRVLPDRFQARLALPPKLKTPFFAGEIDCYEAAHRLMAAAESDPGLSRMVNELHLLGQSILSERQIEPATGMWVETDRDPVFILETGERRYWSLALEAVARQMQEEPLLKVLAESGASRQRQVVENFLREDLCAVEMGKAIAMMILESLEIFPDDGEDEMAYYRKALQVKRMPSGTWLEIERVTGYSRPVLYRHLHILSLGDKLLYLAILYRLPEGALREIVIAPPDQQRGMVLRAIEERMTPAGGSDNSSSADDSQHHSQPHQKNQTSQALARHTQSFLKRMAKQAEIDGNLGEVASELSVLLDLDGIDAAAGILEAFAADLRIIQKRRKHSGA